MAKTKDQKKEILTKIIDKIDKSKTIVFANFKNLGVKENEELRQKLKDEQSEYYVAKKTLLDKAFKDKKLDKLDIQNFSGQVAAIFGYEDEVMPAKITDEFSIAHENKITFLGGILENKFIDAEKVQSLAKVPSKQELYAKLVGSINMPISGFVNVLAGNIRGLVNVLKAVGEQKQ